MKEPYAYTALVTTTAVDDRKQGTFTVERGKDFYWIKGMYSCDNATVEAGTDTTFGGGLVELEYVSGGNRKLQNAPLPIPHYFGQKGIGYGPFVLPAPIMLVGAGTFIVYVTGKIAATIAWRFTFSGVHTNAGEGLRAA